MITSSLHAHKTFTIFSKPMKGGFLQRGGLVVLAAATAITLVAAASAPASMVAPRSICPGQNNPGASAHEQQKAMQCLLNYARSQAGISGLHSSRALQRAAGRKSRDVAACGFSHTACGNAADLYVHRFGYTSGTSGWRWGENLAYGRGKRSTPRRIVEAWLNSSPHRENMLNGSFNDLGIGLKTRNGIGYWALELGCRGC
jgi:uncharacterized protein YkwD